MIRPGPGLPESLYRAEEVRELDRIAIQDFDVPGLRLMERAARVCLMHLRRAWPRARRIAVLCGHGNNGGDGFLLAGAALRAGLAVDVYLVGSRERVTGDAEVALERLADTGLVVHSEPDLGLADLGLADLGLADVVVDAMLGTGLDRDVEGSWAQAINKINTCGRPVVAVDIPSGLHADSGRALGVAVEAAMTVTFIGLKRGLFTGVGRAVCGEIIFDDLQLPADVYRTVEPSARRVRACSFAHALGPRPRDAHKGSFGHTLVMGGDIGYSGAVRLAAEAAARTGSGLVTVATRAEHATTVCADRPELMVRAVQDPATLEPLVERASVIAVGPGLGQSQWGLGLLQIVLGSNRPMVLDADALNLLATHSLRLPPGEIVLTPHPGEAGRLLGTTAREIERDRFAAADALHKRYRAVVVLKGAGTIVVDGEGSTVVCDSGNPGMATAGVGDVLCGVIAGLIAQGLPAGLAAQIGVCIHAEAGDRAARDGERGLLAGDLLAHLRSLVNRSCRAAL